MCRRNWFHYDLRVCTELQVLSKNVSRLSFYANKIYRNGKSRDVQLNNVTSCCPYHTTEVIISVRNIRKMTKKNSNFKRSFIENGCQDRIAAKFCMTILWSSPITNFKLIFILLAYIFCKDILWGQNLISPLASMLLPPTAFPKSHKLTLSWRQLTTSRHRMPNFSPSHRTVLILLMPLLSLRILSFGFL